MPPKRGGRGRGGSRARPPPSVRNAMADLGMGSLANYELLAQAAARGKADAARAYFPEMDKDRKARPVRLLESEARMVKLARDVVRNVRTSPHCVGRGGRRVAGQMRSKRQKGEQTGGQDGWTAEIGAMEAYFAIRKPDAASVHQGQVDDLWEQGKCWLIPERLPPELVPKRARSGADKKHRMDTKGKAEDTPAKPLDGTAAESLRKLGAGDANEDDNADADRGNENEEDAADEEEAAPVPNDDDDDLELDADYQMGNHFDDDEGYEENDSGAEEAVF